MTLKTAENRRNTERRLDKITKKARVVAGTLKRTAGISAAKRYLRQNGFSTEMIHDMMLGSLERRKSRRRADKSPARLQSKKANTLIFSEENLSFLTPGEIRLLYELRSANDTEHAFIRISDLPQKFVRFGLVSQGACGARITLRGHTTLRHWTRARALHSIFCGKVTEASEDEAHIWLKINDFIDVIDKQLVATKRGAVWLENRLSTLNELY
jgi:hypothetical protein